jgi:hypothetical protein
MITDEEWREIPGYAGYSVSNFGRIRSDARIITRPNQPSYELPEKILKPFKMESGHLRQSGSINGKHFSIFVHVAVALAFLGPKKEGEETRHYDGNPANNRLDNLLYGSRSQNIDDAKRHKTFPLLEKRPGAKLTCLQAIEIAGSSIPTTILAKKYGVCAGVIRQIKTGETWESVTREARKLSPWEGKIINFTDDQIKEICNSLEPLRAIARKFNVDRTVIRRIWRQNGNMVGRK